MTSGGEMQSDFTGIERIIAEGGDAMDRWLAGVADQIKTGVKLIMGTSPPGHVYRRGSIEHTASLPGYPPTPDIGSLVGSIHVEKDGASPHTFYVADGVQHGIYQEIGTSTIAARPFMAPVFEQWGTGGKLEADAQTQLKLIDS